eukprot:gene26650-32453_t
MIQVAFVLQTPPMATTVAFLQAKAVPPASEEPRHLHETPSLNSIDEEGEDTCVVCCVAPVSANCALRLEKCPMCRLNFTEHSQTMFKKVTKDAPDTVLACFLDPMVVNEFDGIIEEMRQ